MSDFYATTVQLKKMINNLDNWLGKAADSAKARNFDANNLLSARLAPDQYPLSRQVQAACDSAKFAAARISGKEAPKHADTEMTLDELRARAQSVVAYLGSFTEADFEGAHDRKISLHFIPGMVINAADYATEMALPNTYFHLCMAYAILRHNGVVLGKQDYIGSLTLHPA